MTFTLLEMAAKLAGVAAESELANEASALVQETAKNGLGTYEFGWPPLKEETIARKATGNSPLLETGELRELDRAHGRRTQRPRRHERRQGRVDGVRNVNDTAAELYSLGWNGLRAANSRDCG